MERVWDAAVAAEHGIGRRRLAGRSFERVTAGAYVEAASAGDLAARCRAVQHVRPDAVVSHWTAVVLLGLPLPPTRRREGLHVLVGPGRRPLRRRGVVSHRSEQSVPTVRRHGVLVTGTVRTWCDLARGGATLPELVGTADALLRVRPGDRDALEAAVGAGSGRRGVRSARQALWLADPRAESFMESWLRVLLLSGGVPAPTPQHVVTDGSRFVARVDLAWLEQRLVVEYDGAHHRERAVWVKDLRRREELERLGWRVLVITADDLLHRPAEVVIRVLRALAA